MEWGVIIGGFIFFFIIVPTLFPKTYKRLNDKVSEWTDDSKEEQQGQ